MSLETYHAQTTRARRYRDAGKTLRFHVYVIIELYVLGSLVAALAASTLLSDSPLLWAIHANTVVATVAVIVHYGSLSLHKPWILLARCAEAVATALLVLFVEWLIDAEWHASWQLAACVFAFRYWQVSEKEIARLAYEIVHLAGIAPRAP